MYNKFKMQIMNKQLFGPGWADLLAKRQSQTRPKKIRAAYFLPKPAHGAIFWYPNPHVFGSDWAEPPMIKYSTQLSNYF